MIEIELGMSNCDGQIDEGFETALREKPNEVFGRHAAWNFNGIVYFDGVNFIEDVYVHHVVQKTIAGQTLQGLMEKVNDEFGWE